MEAGALWLRASWRLGSPTTVSLSTVVGGQAFIRVGASIRTGLTGYSGVGIGTGRSTALTVGTRDRFGANRSSAIHARPG